MSTPAELIQIALQSSEKVSNLLQPNSDGRYSKKHLHDAYKWSGLARCALQELENILLGFERPKQD
jgi:hypothetical protein